mmetsp:Transcript_106005/g.300179  ORF Transcript_106005/g.300179 Transcript_106005/m.300179 type:complete len:206 (+) Transcript_106005:137-754(+)
MLGRFKFLLGLPYCELMRIQNSSAQRVCTRPSRAAQDLPWVNRMGSAARTESGSGAPGDPREPPLASEAAGPHVGRPAAAAPPGPPRQRLRRPRRSEAATPGRRGRRASGRAPRPRRPRPAASASGPRRAARPGPACPRRGRAAAAPSGRPREPTRPDPGPGSAPLCLSPTRTTRRRRSADGRCSAGGCRRMRRRSLCFAGPLGR